MNVSNTNDRRRIASLSVDFDNKWAYLRAAGKEDWQSASSYLPVVAERIVEILDEFHLPLTVFVVGRDLNSESDIGAIDSFKQLDSHEYCNHSMNHLPWMHTMDDDEIFDEIAGTHDRIESSLGCRPLGFRGPGFSCPEQVLRVLGKLGYAYDASVFPTSMAPVARAVFLARTKLKERNGERPKSFTADSQRCVTRTDRTGEGWMAFRSGNPRDRHAFFKDSHSFQLLHVLGGHFEIGCKAYLKNAFRLCRLTGTSPSLLLHPPDFLGCEDDQDMAYFPGMKMPRREKLELVRWALRLYARLSTFVR